MISWNSYILLEKHIKLIKYGIIESRADPHFVEVRKKKNRPLTKNKPLIT